MARYNPKTIESKWQKIWEESKVNQATEDTSKPKKYILEYFPYPSGAAMHVGHVRNYTIGDTLTRFMRMQGYNVLHPMGWDAFGLPAENYAIKTGVSPREAIDQNTARFKEQLIQMGFSYDWSREIDSTDPNYYKWTQWFFLMLFKRGLAYQQESLQWWCPVDKTVLANEQVEAGKCWRCGSEVEKKALKQWFFKITEYADRLAKDLDSVDWSDSIKTMQRNWIGRSQGAEISFAVESSKEQAVKVFTTRADTLFGATFLVLAPEHPIVNRLTVASKKQEVESYVQHAQAKSDVERQETDREKTGVFTGSFAINPINGNRIPIWVADYVLMGYGTGAIMAVPAHDNRDYQFAKKFDLPIVRVVKNSTPDDQCTHEEGVMMNSGKYDGLRSEKAREQMVADLVKSSQGQEQINYKMRDWLISRQRYWGAPIPIIHCPNDGVVPVPEEDLPVVLPDLDSFEPSGDGRSPLANVPDFVNTTCPKCNGPAERETDTMDGFACSSWYFLRFADPHNNQKAFDPKLAEYWLPVDDYIGGAEHAVMHLLYARFWTKVMYDEGLITFDEPFKKLRNHGMILAPDGQKMSKSKNNTIEPDGLINQGYGADSIRIMELFIGQWNQVANWSVKGMGGSFRFLQRVWNLVHLYQESPPNDKDIDQKTSQLLRQKTHQTIKKVTDDLLDMGFNTAISAQMELVNALYKIAQEDDSSFQKAHVAWNEALSSLIRLLAPFAPHMCEELWQLLGNTESVHTTEWPKHQQEYLVSETINIVVQVNGKVRANISVSANAQEEEITKTAQEHPAIQKHLLSPPKKTIYVSKKLINFVV